MNVIYDSRVVRLNNCPYYDSRVVIYALKMFIRLATGQCITFLCAICVLVRNQEDSHLMPRHGQTLDHQDPIRSFSGVIQLVQLARSCRPVKSADQNGCKVR